MIIRSVLDALASLRSMLVQCPYWSNEDNESNEDNYTERTLPLLILEICDP